MTDFGTFQCEMCRGVFPKAWSDEDAAAEAKAIHGDLPPEDRATICHDCWLKIKHRWERPN